MATTENLCGFQEDWDGIQAAYGAQYPWVLPKAVQYAGVVPPEGLRFSGYRQTFAPQPLSSFDYPLQTDPYPMARGWRPDADAPLRSLGGLALPGDIEFTD